jgi:putative DNA primase/helicase
VRRLIVEDVGGDAVRSMVADFVASTVPAGADGQIIRAAERLGLIASAGELATFLGVMPWEKGAAKNAAVWAFAQWVAGRGGTEPAEARQAIEAVRSVIAQHGESRFDEVGSDARPVMNRLGWRKGDGATCEYWILPDPWRKECCAGLDAIFVAKTLAERNLLRRPNGRGYQVKVNIGGEHRVNAYVVTAAILDGGEDAS